MDNKEIMQMEREVESYSLSMPTLVSKLKINSLFFELLEHKVDLLINKAYCYNNKITNDVICLCENGVSHMVELEHSHKGKTRLLEKAYYFIDEGNTIEEAINRIEDVLRFTIIIQNDSDYVNKTIEYLDKLKFLGYEIYDFLNFWGGEYYQGFNVLLKYQSLKFELQFHTNNSYYIKEGFTRVPYIVVRNPLSDKDMIEKANVIRKYYQDKVIVPEKAKGFSYIKSR